ncbi:flagellar hook-basal body complex protein FliE [Panacagrimonas perspica]|uniref:Flagellar hook-basal body complex protein FliE n=1 Tax=Panacagrimonas perspica TaxID=381431 RepID=A0A4R7PB07_9GAMM|nr:flagellar hook-basal body complex protein FliE [Panacagrimonas perspica]TDU30759.1 flagellar hook-basal body complex protein FliE [Panacagrimonas perspica]THD01576.1 flagellar hook-basal body complex protein FliE [Panacagrimonas perspica]
MSEIDVRSVLSQIRALQTQATAASRPATPGTEVAPAFGRVMAAAMDKVSLTQATAADLQTKFQLGDANTDLASVMLASSRAQVEFKGLVETRNRMVRAYQDIMNMPL